MKKQCIKCKEVREIELFYFHHKNGNRRNVCSFCTKGYKNSTLLKTKRLTEEAETGHRTCTGCKKLKPFSEYHLDKNNRLGHTVKCKECKKVYSKETREHQRNRRFLHKYDLSLDDYNILLEKQENVCAICKTNKPAGRNGILHVDHDHKTGKIRGLLCHHCNVALGSFFDNIENLERAIMYLKNSRHT